MWSGGGIWLYLALNRISLWGKDFNGIISMGLGKEFGSYPEEHGQGRGEGRGRETNEKAMGAVQGVMMGA